MKTFLRIFVSLAAVFFSSCEGEENIGAGVTPVGPSYIPKDNVFLVRGLKTSGSEGPDKYASFFYTGYEPLKGRPVDVYYYIPSEGDVKTMRVLFCFTGAERTGNTQLDVWKNFADAYEIVLINPQFQKVYFNENAYQFGGVTASKGTEEIRNQELWTYNIVESLFDYWLKEVDGEQTGYRMFGHSAGGQFVGRMIMAMPEARVISAVAANPSTWAWPEALSTEGENPKVYGWPYSIKDLPAASDKAILEKVLSRKLFIQVGQADTLTSSLDVGAAANLQGKRRYDRGVNFHKACADVAAENGISCRFSLAEVAGVGHSTWHMVYGYYKPTPSKIDKAQLGENSAYLLLFDR